MIINDDWKEMKWWKICDEISQIDKFLKRAMVGPMKVGIDKKRYKIPLATPYTMCYDDKYGVKSLSLSHPFHMTFFV